MKTLFLSPMERKIRIMALMDLHGLSWFSLARKMSTSQTAVQLAFCWDKEDDKKVRDVTVSMIIRCAKALGVSAGFLIDREETEIESEQSDNEAG